MSELVPRWMTYEVASKYSSFSHSHLEVLVRRKLIDSKNVRLPEATRGRRLIDRLSIDSYIESCPDDVTALVMNTK